MYNELNGYKKLDVNLPKQRLINERPWAIAGLLFVVAIVLFIIFNYLKR